MNIKLDISEYLLKGQKQSQQITNGKNLKSTTNMVYSLESPGAL